MPGPRALAAAQTTPVRGDVEANLTQHLRLCRLAAERGARILVFPELSLTGYEMQLADRLAFTQSDPRLSPLRAVASTHDIALVVGAPVRSGPHLHIGAFIIAPNGDVDLYTKHHLGAFAPSAKVDGTVPPPEATVFDRGEQNPLLHFKGVSAAIAVCADTGHALHAQAAADRGARAYLASMFVIPSEFEREVANLGQCAARHSMAVVLANHGARSGGLASAGRSAIWSERGERLVQLGASGAGVAIAIEADDGWHTRAVMDAVP